MGTTTDVSRLDVFAGRVYGLDALRALAVVLVITYHLFPLALPGGFIGVDVFFVVSGFLITGLLLRQWRTTGSIDLLHFWQRRARRLIPALVAVVLLTGAAAALVGGDILVGIGRQIVGALTFTSNWIFIASGSSYGSDFYPEPFTHLWSLAVEEQFYLMWPLVVVVVLAWGGRHQERGQGRRRLTPLRLVGTVALGVGAVSAVMMALIAASAADPSRAYYGTDTHLIGLMLGAALAAAVSGYRGRRLLARIRHDRRAKWAVAMVAVAALAVIGAIAAMSTWSQQWTYRGGITVASLATMFVIFALLCLPERSRRGERGALAWVGERSYGLYLYHWPLVVVMFYAFEKVPQWLSGLIVLSGTLMLAALSYRYVEQPIRRLGFRATFRGAIRAMQPIPGVTMRTRRTVSALGLAAAVTVAGTVYGVAVAPSSTQLDQQLAAGSALLNSTDELGLIEDLDETDDVLDIGAELGESADDAANAAGTSPDSSNDVSAAGGDATGSDSSDSRPGATANLGPKASGKNTTIIGDSVTIAAAESLQEQLPGVVISAAVGRNMIQAPDIVKKIDKRGKLRDYVVIALATNSTLTEDQLRKVVRAVGKDRAVILVNGYADRSWIKSTNKTIAQAPTLFGNVVVADWAAVAKKNPKIFGADGVHPKPDRTGAYADVIVAAIEEAQQSVFETTE